MDRAYGRAEEILPREIVLIGKHRRKVNGYWTVELGCENAPTQSRIPHAQCPHS
jgi:hypothetical protein